MGGANHSRADGAHAAVSVRTQTLLRWARPALAPRLLERSACDLPNPTVPVKKAGTNVCAGPETRLGPRA